MSEQEIARPKLNREIATTADGVDITRGYTGPLMVPFDSVLRNRGGYDLEIYQQVLSDEEVKATFGQRQSAVTSCEWRVEPGGDRRVDKQAAEHLEKQLKKLKWDAITQKMLFGVFYGYAVGEVIYHVEDGKVAMRKIAVRDRRRFRYGKDGDLRMLTHSSMFEGVPCERPYFWDFCCGADHDDEPYGLGLAHWLYWPVLFKRNGIKFWLMFLEKFGMPTGVGKYDPDASDGERLQLLRAVRAMQADSGIIVPKSMEIDLLEAGRSGTADYAGLFSTMNASIQKAVLGQTASTQGTPGKLGNEDLQGDVRKDIIKTDADLVCESFNMGPAMWLTRWNFPTAELPRVFRVTEEDEDLTQRAERDDKIQTWGFKPTLAYVKDTYGGDWTERQQTPPPELDEAGNVIPPSAISGAEFAAPEAAVVALMRRHGVQFAEQVDTDPSVPLARQLDRRIQPAGKQWNEQIRGVVDAAESFEDLEQRLLALAPEMGLDDYALAFAQAMSVAQLAGRYDVMQS